MQNSMKVTVFTVLETEVVYFKDTLNQIREDWPNNNAGEQREKAIDKFKALILQTIDDAFQS